MKSQRIALLLTILAANVFCRDPQPPAEAIRQMAEYVRKYGALGRQSVAAVSSAQAKEEALRRRASALRRSYDPKQVGQIKARLQRLEVALEGLRVEFAVARIEDPEKRAAKRQEAEAVAATASEAVKLALAPLHEEEAKLRRSHSPVESALEKLAAPVGRVVVEMGAASTIARARVAYGMASVTWLAAPQRSQFARMEIRLTQVQKPRKEVMKLAGKYPVHSLSDSFIKFMVGPLECSFVANKPEWRDSKKLPRLAEALIDFVALAAFSSTVETNTELRQQVAKCVSEQKDWQVRMQSAARGTQSGQPGTGEKLRELRRPYNVARVAQLERRIASQEKNVAGLRGELSAAAIEGVEARKLAREKAVEDAKLARQAVLVAGMPFQGERLLLSRLARYADFDAWEMVDAVALVPEGMGIIGSKVSPALSGGAVNVAWFDAHGKSMAVAYLSFKPVPKAVPEQTKLAGKYPVPSWRTESIMFWAGGVNVTLRVAKEEWRNKEKILGLVMKLLDVDAIAAWPKIEDVK